MLCGWRDVGELSDGDGGEFLRLHGWRDVGELLDGDGGEFQGFVIGETLQKEI